MTEQINYSEEQYKAPQLKEILIEMGYAEEDLVGLRKVQLVQMIEDSKESDDSDEEDNKSSFGEVELDEDDIPIPRKSPPKQEEKIVPAPPMIGTPEWQSFVMSKFADSDKWVFEEKDANGKVRKIETISAKALARVGKEIFGQPLSEGPIREELSFNGPKNLPYAYVVYQVVLEGPTGPRVFTASADTSYLNTEDKFLAFPLRTSETKAMGCAWVKALAINVFAKEEMPTKDAAKAVEETSADWNGDEEITANQKKTIMNLCSKLRITVHHLLNMNKEYKYDGKINRFEDLDDSRLTKKNGVNLIDKLGQMVRNEIKVDESLRTSNDGA